jgi:voltage-gated potassium channel
MTTLLSKFCCFLSFLLFFSVGWQTFYKLTPETYLWLNFFDTSVCFWYIADWLVKFRSAKWQISYLKWGWFDLLLCVPFTNAIWVQYHTVIRFFRAFKAVKYIHDYFHACTKTSKFVDVCIISFAFIAFAAISVFNCEKHVEGANIKNLSDALWWAMATITTIGYGDRYPVSDLGRFVASFVMIGGVGLYASFTAFIVMLFQPSDDRLDKIIHENKLLHDKLDIILESWQDKDR